MPRHCLSPNTARHDHAIGTAIPPTMSAVTPFRDAEEAWFWFMTAYEARHSGARIVAGRGVMLRPCEPLDVLRVVDRLYRQRRLFLDHLRVLNFYGRRQSPPDPRRDQECRADSIWREAMLRIEPMLRAKGIVA